MKRTIQSFLLLFFIMSLSACNIFGNNDNNNPEDDNDIVPFEETIINDELQTIFTDNTILEVQMIHADYVILYETDTQEIKLLRYDLEDGITMNTALSNEPYLVEPYGDNEIYVIEEVDTNNYDYTMYQEDGVILFQGRNIHPIYNKDFYLHAPVVNPIQYPLYDSLTNSYYSLEQTTVNSNGTANFHFFKYTNGEKTVLDSFVSEQTTDRYVYTIIHMLVDRTFLIKHSKVDDSSHPFYLKHYSLSGSLIREETFTGNVFLSSVDDGYLVYTSNNVQKYSLDSTLSWEVAISGYNYPLDYNDTSYRSLSVLPTDDDHDLSIYTVSKTGEVQSIEPITSEEYYYLQSRVVPTYVSTLSNGGDVYIDPTNEFVSVTNGEDPLWQREYDGIVDVYVIDDAIYIYTDHHTTRALIILDTDGNIMHSNVLTNDLISIPSSDKIFTDCGTSLCLYSNTMESIWEVPDIPIKTTINTVGNVSIIGFKETEDSPQNIILIDSSGTILQSFLEGESEYLGAYDDTLFIHVESEFNEDTLLVLDMEGNIIEEYTYLPTTDQAVYIVLEDTLLSITLE